MVLDKEIVSRRDETQKKNERLNSGKECLVYVFEKDCRKENFPQMAPNVASAVIPVVMNACKI